MQKNQSFFKTKGSKHFEKKYPNTGEQEKMPFSLKNEE